MHDRLVGLMAEPLGPAIALASGVVLGLVFYAGLWWTVRRAATFRRPGASILASLLVRMGITLGGFYLAADGDWARLLLCLSGFLLARVVVTWWTRLPCAATGAGIGASHAP